MSRTANTQIFRATKTKLTSFNERLRFVRESLGISRYEVERIACIDEATLRKVEKSENDFVPSDIILKLYKYFENFSKYIDPMWLIYGIGEPPNFLNQINFNFNENKNDLKLSENLSDEENNIIVEILTWQQLYKNSIYLKIFTDLLIPKYKKDDYICGIFFDKINLANMEPIEVIVSTIDNSGLSPYYFLKMNNNDAIFCQFTTSDSSVQTKVLNLDKIDKVARIVMHRKTMMRK
ncbi:MAG: helix-turn-helix domain-containing protein [Silvanigrellaceae bacterium]|nr:helix-turn-helix domain-containing protein [Silvanigrellaceae bacterium]